MLCVVRWTKYPHCLCAPLCVHQCGYVCQVSGETLQNTWSTAIHTPITNQDVLLCVYTHGCTPILPSRH